MCLTRIKRGAKPLHSALLPVLSCVLLAACLLILPPQPASADQTDAVRGMYGVPGDDIEKTIKLLRQGRVTHVFAPPYLPTITRLKKEGFQVFLTLNAFGGTAAWKQHPDAVPVTAAGEKVSSHLGGVCPTHFSWREERLALLASWLRQFGTGGDAGIDGVWLDFARYPGRWESRSPEIPDSCYCPRCLQLFQVEKGVAVPEGLATSAAAAWIHGYAEEKWLQWKKEQITSFVRDAREVLDQAQAGRPIKLGVFLVPWTRGERQGAVTFRLAQDAVQIARYVDVVSPMVYHRMVNEPAAWTGEIAAYFQDMTGKPVWPIIQAEKIAAAEFGQAVDAVAASGAPGVLVYTLPEMQEGMWPALAAFTARENLLPNPQFRGEPQGDGQTLPDWRQGNGGTVRDTAFLLEAGDDRQGGVIGITAGLDRQGRWRAAIPDCDPGKTYTFAGDFHREQLQLAGYPAIEVWGREYILNTHRVAGEFQRLRVAVECPADRGEGEETFAFINTVAGSTFRLRNPELVEEPARPEAAREKADTGFFALGTYGATVDNLSRIKEMGLNTAVLPMDAAAIEACIEHDMHCLLSVPRDAEKLLISLAQVKEGLAKGRFSFYVNDEPEIHSFPRWQARDIATVLADSQPAAATSMAVVRPQNIPDYVDAARYFMLDQYPVPYMPMTWLSGAMDQAAGFVGRNRLQSVIQAFGGSEWSDSGWPRLPSFAEMNCLAFLSVIHGSRGIYFYTFPSITTGEEGMEDFRKVVVRLGQLLPWLQQENLPGTPAVEMLSANRFDPQGRPAVHCALKEKGEEKMLLCVNTLPTYTKAAVTVPGSGDSLWREVYDQGRAMAVDSSLHLDFLPLEVKVLQESAE
jgi:hypothetical protein